MIAGIPPRSPPSRRGWVDGWMDRYVKLKKKKKIKNGGGKREQKKGICVLAFLLVEKGGGM